MRLVGYPDSLSVPAGETLKFFVSSEAATFSARLVRLIHGIKDQGGPGLKVEVCPSNIDGDHLGRMQPIACGSYARVAPDKRFALLEAFTLGFWIWPTTPQKPTQMIFSCDEGLSLRLDAGRLTLAVGERDLLQLPSELFAREWYFVCIRADARGELRLSLYAPGAWPPAKRQADIRETFDRTNLWTNDAPLIFAARSEDGTARDFYNGKLENPWLLARNASDEEVAAIGSGQPAKECPGCLSAWDFAKSSHSDRIVDEVGGLNGVLVNMPARAMTGHAWAGQSDDFRRAPHLYGAIHFHDDDLSDARWEPSFELSVPASLKSGIYAIHLLSESGEDHVPFVVTPPAGRATADVLFLVPTLTYLAYGDEAIANRPDIRALLDAVSDDAVPRYPVTPEDRYLVKNRLLSCYDIHADGSGVCYSSSRRPLLNMRPSYLMPLHGLSVRPGGAAHLLAADLCIADWLENEGIAFDAITDHELDASGAEVLSRYKVVITGSHPEYYTERMLDAVRDYCESGGKVMYLGGNGFFCVTSLAERGHAIETRRARTNRAWTSCPGEEHHSMTGEIGGPWRNRGQPPNSLVGVGTSAVGFTSGRGYVRTPASREEPYGWVFEGIEDDVIGAFPNLIYGDGAAGWEIDKADVDLGTPRHTTVLASARITDDSYHQIIDELLAAGPHTGGATNPNVRADMTMLSYPNDGAVFAVGSCMWAGALSYNNYRNNVSRVTANVLRQFVGESGGPR